MADRLTIEHYIAGAFVKCGQVILGSRILPTGPAQQQPRSARDKRTGRSFLLELEEMDGFGKEVDLWRKDLTSPLVIEIRMAPGTALAAANAAAAASAGSGRLAAGRGGSSDAVSSALPGELLFTPLERWTLQYERNPPPGSSSSMAGTGGGGSSSSSSGTRTYRDEVSIYKRLIILVRSLYSYTRILPAYKLFRAAKRYAGEQAQFQMQYKIHHSLQQQAIGGPGITTGHHHTTPRLQDFAFAPIETPSGRFHVAVQYNPAVAALVLEHSTAPMAMPYTLNENYLGPGGAAAAAGSGPLTCPSGFVGAGAYAAPGTSAPASAGMALRNLRPAMSASGYGATASHGRSPPADGGVRRHTPFAACVGSGGGGAAPGVAGAAAAPALAAPARVIVRQSWSSKDMVVSFSLPPPLGSPGAVGLGGGAAGVFRRSSSGYGSTPSTPPLPSPVNAPGRAEGAGSSGGAPPPPTASASAASVVGSYIHSHIHSHHRPPLYQQHHQLHQQNSQQQQQQQVAHQAHPNCGSGGSGGVAVVSSQLSSTPPKQPGSVIGATSGHRAGEGGGGAPIAAAAAPSSSSSSSIPHGTTARSLPGSCPPVRMSAFAAANWQQQVAPVVCGIGTPASAAAVASAAAAAAAPSAAEAGEQTQQVGVRTSGSGVGGAAAQSGRDGGYGTAAGSAAAASTCHDVAGRLIGADADAEGGDTAAAVAAAAREGGNDIIADAAAAAATATATTSDVTSTGSGAASRTTSAPLAIPSRASSRTRSVVDLRAPAVYGGFEVHPAVAAAAASSRTAATAAAAVAAGHPSSQEGSADAASTEGAAAAAVVAASASASHHRMAPGSAPAAPRGMLGLALGALKPGTGGSGLGGTATASAANTLTHFDTAGAAVGKAGVPTVGDGGVKGPLGSTSGGDTNGGAAGPGDPTEERVPSDSTAVAANSVPMSSGGAVAAAAAAPAECKALAVVRPTNCHLHNQHSHHHHRSNAFLPSYVAGVPGSSPPGGRPLPVPIGSLPPYGSPQLPFAFTPSVQSMSLASLHQAMVSLGYFGGHTGGAPSGGGPRAVSGRDITCLATIRRPSWSSRSGSLDPSLASAGAAGPLMPSLSPLHDLLESSFSNPSTPGAPNLRPDSSDQTRRTTSRRCRNPSSSSTSAIFSLSPSSAVPGTSPPPHAHLHHQHRIVAVATAVVSKAIVTAAEKGRAVGGGGGSGGGGGGGGCTQRKETATAGQEHARPVASKTSSSGGAGVVASGGGDDDLANTRSTAGDGAAPDDDGDDSACDGIDGAEGLAPQLGGETMEDAVQYDMYGRYGDPDIDPGTFPLAREDSESDLLPFALDQEGLVLSPGGGVPGAPFGAAAILMAARADPAGRPGHSPAGPIELTLSIAQARERDVAVGAFIRMMVDAAPLCAPSGHPAVRELAPRQALAELEQLGAQIRAALEGIAPQLAAAQQPTH